MYDYLEAVHPGVKNTFASRYPALSVLLRYICALPTVNRTYPGVLFISGLLIVPPK